eukprot:jgi/Bigna1/83298/fgenesh1_pg.105_\
MTETLALMSIFEASESTQSVKIHTRCAEDARKAFVLCHTLSAFARAFNQSLHARKISKKCEQIQRPLHHMENFKKCESDEISRDSCNTLMKSEIATFGPSCPQPTSQTLPDWSNAKTSVPSGFLASATNVHFTISELGTHRTSNGNPSLDNARVVVVFQVAWRHRSGVNLLGRSEFEKQWTL